MNQQTQGHPETVSLAREVEQLKQRVQALEQLLHEDHRKIERIAHEHEHDHTVLERMEHDPYNAGRRNFTVGL